MYQDFDNKRNEDYLDAFKQKVAEQKIATIEERRHEQARSWNNFFGTLAGAVLAVAVGWFILMPQYKQGDKEVPTIRRSQTAVKVKPENPGGMDIPNQDKEVYNLVEKKEVDDTVVENLLPTPEEPKLPDIVPETVEAEANAAETDANAVEEAQNNVPEKPVDLLKETAESAKADVKEAVKEVKNDAGKVTQNAQEKVQKAEADVKKAVESKTESLVAAEKENTDKLKAKASEAANKVNDAETEVKAKAATVADAVTGAENAVAKAVSDGKWQVQFVASKNQAAVEKTWGDLTKKYSMLQAYNHEVQKADLGAQGIVYRLRAGNFATRDDASKVCAALKAKGMNDCIVKER